MIYRDRELGREWRKKWAEQKGVKIRAGDICQLQCDAIVSPGNSRGDMGGGLDYLIRDRFGQELEKRLKQEIKNFYGGFLPVGQAVIIPTFDCSIPWFVSVPTMESPREIKGTDNVERAMQAVLRAVNRKDQVKTVAVPGLGTGVGGLSYNEAAEQMYRGFLKYCQGEGD